ncbi:helix-turn-helix domain-containing protein [Flavobacterium noncentrifugens]|uniref:Helix-turn-helix domain-containing protein n=1 Tax=Flavobacterium noncentrifugens TaxID=1128970 RepID=A0A1G8WQR2_9FLAO|nr:helix-turn-helix domain-containing protein [Flavobacterium noncentrifugens]SDJ80634.1 Helix-turn-helix domain-containing protein [Flavobacterium noncentrifugens]
MPNKIQKVKTISQYHQLRGLPKPEHPLISLIDYSTITAAPENNDISYIFDFYSISLKRNFDAKIKYGQQEYDFDEGIMFFMAPGQVFSIEVQRPSSGKRTGWMLLVHPDFLWNMPLSKTIKDYHYFDYAANEALFLSEKEEITIVNVMQNIHQEYCSNIDVYSQDIIIAQLELLLSYAQRFYNRQFITRKIATNNTLIRLQELLNAYFDNVILEKGLPTVQYIADALHLSPGYLGSLLKNLTGQTTQQHIHDKLIEKAKEKLSASELSISEIAYELGFEHHQSFSKFFKAKTQHSPLAFRQSFN